jgi:hypothetical protein
MSASWELPSVNLALLSMLGGHPTGDQAPLMSTGNSLRSGLPHTEGTTLGNPAGKGRTAAV